MTVYLTKQSILSDIHYYIPPKTPEPFSYNTTVHPVLFSSLPLELFQPP